MFHQDILTLAKENKNFRDVLFTSKHTQLVVMSLNKGEDIGSEVHHHNDQVLLFVEGEGRVEVGNESSDVGAGDCVAVPAGSLHNVTNTGDGELKIVTIYGPANHDPDTVHATKADALEDEGLPE